MEEILRMEMSVSHWNGFFEWNNLKLRELKLLQHAVLTSSVSSFPARSASFQSHWDSKRSRA
jgi:hypothetical protein